ncbi:MAG: hypothetical protein VKO64_02980 [Candidatus Sericytochromatia bacterium]|nr:hypothetical protein [Candidatus Sericytochromatia bacterium]
MRAPRTFRPLFTALAATATVLVGCNLSPAQVQQAVQNATTLLQNAGIKLDFLDENGQAQTLAEEDVEAVVVDGRTLGADEYDIVNGEVRFTKLEANDQTRQVEIRLKDVDQAITTSIVAKEGEQAPSVNRVAIAQDSLGGVVFQRNGDATKLSEEQRKRDIAARVTWDLRPFGLVVPPVRAGFITKDGMGQTFPQMAASWSARVLAFDVQVFNLIAGVPSSASTTPVIDKARLPGARLWFLSRKADGKVEFQSTSFLQGAVELKFAPAASDSPLPLPQLLGPTHIKADPAVPFNTLEDALRAKQIREFVPDPASGSLPVNQPR